RVGKRALKSRALVLIAALAFVGIFFFAIPFPIIILAAAAAGFAGRRLGLPGFVTQGHDATKEVSERSAAIDTAFAREIPAHVRPSLGRFFAVLAVGLVIWLGPVLALYLKLGPDNVFTAIAAFNAKMAVVTFGGAYAVLAYMAQQAVEHYHWLKPDEMLVGLG